MKRFLISLLGILCILFCKAQTVSRETALIVAQNYWNILYADKGRCTGAKVSIISPNAKAPLYIIQMDDGWVLVSSEKAVVPILVSSPSGVFPQYKDMPPGMQWLLSYYEDANEYARDSIDVRITHVEWEQLLNGSYSLERDMRDELPSSYVLSRMALVKWNQSENNDYSCVKPYNAQCPATYNVSCGKTLVGCGAVALGMVMWYWQWPWSAIIPRQLYNNAYVNTPYLAMYDWAHMPPELYDSTIDYDAGLLAYFLKDCGYAINMNYTGTASSSSIANTRIALQDVFHYKPVSHIFRSNFSTSNWISLLKQEIYAGRPVIYRGSGSYGGHAFVLFGYTADNKFRINWGWGGLLIDASYSLDALTPGTFNFNSDQAALTGIEPNSPLCLTYNFVGQSDFNNNLFEIQKGGVLVTDSTHGEIHINSNQKGCIYASDAIVIYRPFIIENGAQVHIALRDALCDSDMISPSYMPSYFPSEEDTQKTMPNSYYNTFLHEGLKISPNPARDYVEIHSNSTLKEICIINSTGLCMIRSSNLFIPIYHFSPGLYIVCATTEDGNILQTKLLKQ